MLSMKIIFAELLHLLTFLRFIYPSIPMHSVVSVVGCGFLSGCGLLCVGAIKYHSETLYIDAM